MAAPDLWYEKAFVAIATQGGTDVEMRTKTRTFKDSGAAFDIEGVETFGGKITRLGAHEDCEISFDVNPVEASDWDTLFLGPNVTAGTGTYARPKYRVTLLWTDDATVTSAVQAVASGSNAYRRIYAEAYLTNFEPGFDAGDYVKGTVTCKLPPFDKSGNLNIKVNSVTGSAALASCGAYTSANKF